MKKLKLILLACVMTFASAAVGCSFGGKDNSSVENAVSINLYVDNDDLTVAVASSKQMRVDVENGSKNDVVYEVVSGPATIQAGGLLTVNETANVGDKIQVVAKIGEITSNTLEFTVVGATATMITVTPSANTIFKGETITFTVAYTPAYAVGEYTLAIEGNANDFAEIVDGALKIKDDAQAADINGKQINVKATLNANSAVFAYAFISVEERAAVTYLSCETLNIVASRDSNKSIITEAYSWDGDEMDIAASSYTYEVADENVVTVDTMGKVTVKGHGSTTVTVKYGASVSAECTVNVMIAPEAIKFEKLNAHMADAGEVYFGMGEGNYLDLGVTTQTKTGYVASTQALTYRFEDVASGEVGNFATVTEEGISFNQTGKIRVTVLSNSSVGGYEVSEQYEVKKSIVINVNEGMNVYTPDDLKAYASTANAGKAANILADIYFDENNYAGTEENKYRGIEFCGSRSIYGNGCIISLERMPRGESETTIAYNLFHFYPNGNNPFSVSVVDLTFVGNTNIEGKHLDGTDITLQGERGLKNNYLNVMEFAGANVAEYDAGTKNAYVESVTIKNVDIKGFYKGMRFEHVVSALVENVTIDDCFGNGIENVQSHLTLKDVEIGRVGAFGVEVTSDDMRGVKNPSVVPAGTAGRQYNETSTIKYEGFFKSNNYNNGASTVYMQKLGQEMGFSIADLVKAAAGNIIYSITSDAEKQVKLNAILDQTIKNEEEELNFSTLVFVNPGEFTQYLEKGNTENKFCEFNTTEKINVKTLLENYLAAEEQGQEYDITEKKHLIIDLAGLDLGFGVPVNLGQIILVNMAYQGK